MTMHLMSPAYNTINGRKRKPKMTKGNIQRWSQEMKQYNKRARQFGDQQLTLDQYIDYVHGKGLPKKERKFEEWKPKPNPLHRTTEQYPSHDERGKGHTAKRESQQYTGDFVIGIATLHKSNAVPVTNPKYAAEISQMAK